MRGEPVALELEVILELRLLLDAVFPAFKDVMDGEAADMMIQKCPGFHLDFLHGSITNGDFVRL